MLALAHGPSLLASAALLAAWWEALRAAPSGRCDAGSAPARGLLRRALARASRSSRSAARAGEAARGAAEARMEAGGEPLADGHAHGAEDAELRALRAGDEAAFLALVNRHHAAMVRVAATYVGSRATAEEVAQEAWVGVLKGLHLFEGRASLKGWIFRILVNCAKARGVREVRSVPLSSLAREGEDDEEPAVPAERFRDQGLWVGHWAQPPAAWTDDRLGQAELAALVRDGIALLPPTQRQVMTLRDVDGWESAEVCELLSISEANQRVLLHRARSKVRAFVEARLSKEVRS